MISNYFSNINDKIFIKKCRDFSNDENQQQFLDVLNSYKNNGINESDYISNTSKIIKTELNNR